MTLPPLDNPVDIARVGVRAPGLPWHLATDTIKWYRVDGTTGSASAGVAGPAAPTVANDDGTAKSKDKKPKEAK